MARVIIRISLNGNNPEVTKQLTRVQKTLAEEWAGGFQRIGTAMWQGTAEPEQAGRVIALLLSAVGAGGETRGPLLRAHRRIRQDGGGVRRER